MEAIGLKACPVCGEGYPPQVGVCPRDGSPLGAVDPLLGALVAGAYRIQARVGTGGMGAVYRAVQERFERHVAIKVVSSNVLDNADSARRFQKEAQIIARLHHPSTLKLFDFGRLPDGRPFLVTEFLKGQTLGDAAEAGPMGWTRIATLLGQVCASLEEAHRQGVVHRDLKPDNVFVIDVHGEEVAKVLDFGIAKLGSSTETATGLVFGTPAYMSPEQASGHTASAQSDVYSLGIIAYRCLSGQLPFQSEQPMALLLKHINEPPPPLRERLPAPERVPEELETLVMACLAKNPASRPRGAAAVRMVLERLLHEASPNYLPADATVVTLEAHLQDARIGREATSPHDALPSGPLPTVGPSHKTAIALALALLALGVGGFAALAGAIRGEPVVLVEQLDVPKPPAATLEEPPSARPAPIEQAPEAVPPPLLEPSLEAPPLEANEAKAEPEDAPVRTRKPRRRGRSGRRSGPTEAAEEAPEEKEAPPGFLDFEIP